MQDSAIKYTKIRLGRWNGLAADIDSGGNKIEPSYWSKQTGNTLMSESDDDEILKVDQHVKVIKRRIEIGSREYSLALKFTKEPFVKVLFREPKVLRIFKTGITLIQKGISTAWPILAASRRKGRWIESLYVTEYIEQSENLYWFAVKHPEILKKFSLKRDIERKVAEIFALLYKSDLWHRDAKAGNIIIQKPDNMAPELFLVDLDGIKFHGMNDRKKLLARSISKLGSTLMWSEFIGRNDACRMAKYLSQILDFKDSDSHYLSREIMSRSLAERMMTIINSTAK